MKLQPLADRIVIKKVEAETKSSAGILLPDSAQKKSLSGEVLSIGSEVKEVKVGDVVLYAQYGPVEIEDEGLVVVKEEDVLAVVKGGK